MNEPTAQPEQMLLDDPTEADLSTKVIEAWREFARALAGVLPKLAEGSRLTITLDPTASGTGDAVYATSVLAGPAGALTAFAVGNASLPEEHRMSRASVADMIALGWSPPGVVPGSGDHFGLATHSDSAPTLATVLARTMRDVFGAPHPAFIVYTAQDGEDKPIALAPLGTARPAGSGRADEDNSDGVFGASLRGSEPALVEKVRSVVSDMLKIPEDELPVDSDGDIGIRSGSAIVFVRVRTDPPLVEVFSPVLIDIEPSEPLYQKLSELTTRMPIGRLYHANNTIWASISVFGRSFQPIHLMLAIEVMTGLADELDDRLHGEFGGRRFFGEGDKVATKRPSEHTGMYL